MKRILTRRKEIEIQLFFYEYFLFHIETVYTGNYIQHDKLKVHERFLKIDTNGDGKLSKEEFITVCLQGDYLLRLFAPGAS
jgi:hypothetical protein